MALSNERRRQLSVLAALTAALLPACGGGGDMGSTAMAPSAAPAPAPAIAPAPAPTTDPAAAPAPTPAPTPMPGY